MNRQKCRMTRRFVFVAIAVLGMVLMVGGPNDTTQAQENVAGGQVSVRSPDGTIEMKVRGNGPLTYSVSVNGEAVCISSLAAISAIWGR